MCKTACDLSIVDTSANPDPAHRILKRYSAVREALAVICMYSFDRRRTLLAAATPVPWVQAGQVPVIRVTASVAFR